MKFSSASQTSTAISLIIGARAGATSAMVVGIPLGAALEGIASVSSAVSLTLCCYKKHNEQKSSVLNYIYNAKASYEYAFSESLSGGISLEELARLQNIFNDLLKNINNKLYKTEMLTKDFKQEDFLQNITTMLAKKS